MEGINPRYAAYAKSHGHTPDEQRAADEIRWPGGRMAGFVRWVSEQLRAFRKAHPEAFGPGQTLHDQDAFTAWLETP